MACYSSTVVYTIKLLVGGKALQWFNQVNGSAVQSVQFFDYQWR